MLSLYKQVNNSQNINFNSLITSFLKLFYQYSPLQKSNTIQLKQSVLHEILIFSLQVKKEDLISNSQAIMAKAYMVVSNDVVT